MTTSSRWEQTLHSATRVTVQYHTCECAPSSDGVRRCQSGECKREGAVTRAQLQFFTRVPLLGVQSDPGARRVPCSGMLVRAHAVRLPPPLPLMHDIASCVSFQKFSSHSSAISSRLSPLSVLWPCGGLGLNAAFHSQLLWKRGSNFLAIAGSKQPLRSGTTRPPVRGLTPVTGTRLRRGCALSQTSNPI